MLKETDSLDNVAGCNDLVISILSCKINGIKINLYYSDVFVNESMPLLTNTRVFLSKTFNIQGRITYFSQQTVASALYTWKKLSETAMIKISFLITGDSYQINFLPFISRKGRERRQTVSFMSAFLLLT